MLTDYHKWHVGYGNPDLISQSKGRTIHGKGQKILTLNLDMQRVYIQQQSNLYPTKWNRLYRSSYTIMLDLLE